MTNEECIYYIYQITCIDPNIKDTYVGRTNNLQARIGQHRRRCINKNNTSRGFHYPLYKFMRQHGGWSNWKIDLIEEIICNELQCELREEFHRKKLNATLNGQMCRHNLSKAEYDRIYRYHINNAKVRCECGCIVAKSNLHRHKTSEKHKKQLTNSLWTPD